MVYQGKWSWGLCGSTEENLGPLFMGGWHGANCPGVGINSVMDFWAGSAGD
jgi:hypothetical protein